MGAYDLTLGVLFIGIVFNTYLYGIVTFQYTAYLKTTFHDRLSLKTMVTSLFLLDTMFSISVIYMGWVYCIANYDNPAVLRVGLWPYFFTPIATAISASTVQIFLGYRVYRLLNNIYIYGLIIVSSLVSFGLAAYSGGKAWSVREIVKFSVVTKATTGWLTIQAGLDLGLSGLLILCLLRSKTGFSKTDHIVNRMIRGALQTGVFAAVFALAVLVTFLRYTDTNIYGMFAVPIGRIYTITLLDTLLTRESLRTKLATSGHIGDTSGRNRSDIRWGQGQEGITLEERAIVTVDVVTKSDAGPQAPQPVSFSSTQSESDQDLKSEFKMV